MLVLVQFMTHTTSRFEPQTHAARFTPIPPTVTESHPYTLSDARARKEASFFEEGLKLGWWGMMCQSRDGGKEEGGWRGVTTIVDFRANSRASMDKSIFNVKKTMLLPNATLLLFCSSKTLSYPLHLLFVAVV
jgi:hypothetical protein